MNENPFRKDINKFRRQSKICRAAQTAELSRKHNNETKEKIYIRRAEHYQNNKAKILIQTSKRYQNNKKELLSGNEEGRRRMKIIG